MTAINTSGTGHHARTFGQLTELDELAELARYLDWTMSMRGLGQDHAASARPTSGLLNVDSFIL